MILRACRLPCRRYMRCGPAVAQPCHLGRCMTALRVARLRAGHAERSCRAAHHQSRATWTVAPPRRRERRTAPCPPADLGFRVLREAQDACRLPCGRRQRGAGRRVAVPGRPGPQRRRFSGGSVQHHLQRQEQDARLWPGLHATGVPVTWLACRHGQPRGLACTLGQQALCCWSAHAA